MGCNISNVEEELSELTIFEEKGEINWNYATHSNYLKKFKKSSNCMANAAEYMGMTNCLQMNLIDLRFYNEIVPLIFASNGWRNILKFKDSKILCEGIEHNLV